MRGLRFALLVLMLSLVSSAAFAGPRDASAVMLHCGQATLADTTIYENHTVAGGRRILKYLAGTLNFDRVGNEGWTFTYGAHGKKDHLDADEMGKYMPCLTVALADSAAPVPLAPVTPVERVETSMKRPYEKLIGGSVIVLLVLVIAYFVLGRRNSQAEEDD